MAVHNDLPTSDFGALRLAAQEGGYLEIEGGSIYSLVAAGSFFDQVMPAVLHGQIICPDGGADKSKESIV
ncbi:MAG TPA: hypothetical protein VFJ57_02515 [Solirubrobacterales bacterium]|nr:hypothetical protein [Solirubrobacterales bacterium]